MQRPKLKHHVQSSARPVAGCRRFVFCLSLLAGCASYPKHMHYGRYESQAMRVQMNYAVYTPPGFHPKERLPLVIFLHGGGDDHESFDRWGIASRLNAAIAAGRIPRVVIALPEGHMGFWSNWADGSRYYEDWVIREMLPQIQRQYHTMSCPNDCYVMGVSMGGAGTMRFLFHYKGWFDAAGVISAPILNTDAMLSFGRQFPMSLLIPAERIWGNPTRQQVEKEDPFLQWNSKSDVGARLYLAWAKKDREMIRYGSQRLHRHLQEQQVPHASEEFQGQHNWKSWAPVIERALAFMLAN